MTTPITLRVPPDAPPERIDRYLVRACAATGSRAQLQRWIHEGFVHRNDQVVTPSTIVRPGDRLTVLVPPPALPTDLAPERMPLEILYEDDALLVLNKPAGLVVHPGAGHLTGTLVHGLLAHTTQLSGLAGPSKPGLVHRLDKDTSGVMVVAKQDAAHRALAQQFEARTIQRTYVALVAGVVRYEHGVITAPLGRHPRDRQRIAVQPPGRGREAVTRYRVLRRLAGCWPAGRTGAQSSAGCTLLELSPQTGRTHQLRVHLAHLGHPILGDPKYGRRPRLPREEAAPGASPRSSGPARADRQLLHAARLGFLHPATGEQVEFAAPWPDALTRLLGTLEKAVAKRRS